MQVSRVIRQALTRLRAAAGADAGVENDTDDSSVAL
jgi:hypothetical protein